MTDDERKRLTEYEIDSLYQISHRVQPRCPGCGEPMRLDLGLDIDGKNWLVSYVCYWGTGCAEWRTKIFRGTGIVKEAEDAYKAATRRVEK